MLLTCRDAVPGARRILAAGVSGSGKTTLARRLAAMRGLPYVELDSLFHGPGWVPRPEFLDDVRQLAAGDRWVTEWQYGDARPILLERADLLLWLDLPAGLVMRQVIVRTLRRRFRREVLWNGNVEPPLWTIVNDPGHIIRWAWTSRHRTGERVRSLLQERPDLPVVRLRSHRDAAEWLRVQTLSSPPGAS